MTKPKNQDTHLKRTSVTKADVTHAASMQILETARVALTNKMERLKNLRLEAERLNPAVEPVPLRRRTTKKAT